MQWYIHFNEDGTISGFYNDLFNAGGIPESAIPITEAQQQTYSANGGNLYRKAESGDDPARLKTQEELDAEVANYPTLPKTPDQLMIEMMQVQSGELLFELALAQDDSAAKDMQMGVMLMQLAAIQEGMG